MALRTGVANFEPQATFVHKCGGPRKFRYSGAGNRKPLSRTSVAHNPHSPLLERGGRAAAPNWETGDAGAAGNSWRKASDTTTRSLETRA